jgi:hypothetical protein
MENRLSKYTVSFGLAFALASVFNAMLVVVKEKSHAMQGWMQKMTGHHWVTHSLIVIVVFVLLGLLFARANGGQGPKIAADSLIKIVAGAIMAGYLIITGFYLIAG